MAHYVIGWTQSGPEREAEKISSMQAAVSVPKDVSPYEHTMDAEARSRAGLILAHHYESRKEWSRALEMWRAWLSHATCGLHVSENRESRSLGIARCLDALGRIDEAKLHYWEGTSIAHCEDLASAERLIEIHRELQTESELIAKVRTQVTWLLQHEYEVKGAMKCFADELGVPTR
jgi:hypothetical protein